MKISRSLVAAALSGALVLGGATAAIAQIPEASDSINIPLPATIEIDGVTYFKKTTTGDDGEDVDRYESADGKEISVLQVKSILDRRNDSKEEEQESESSTAASESEKTSEPKATTSEKTSEPKATTSEKTSEPKATESASATKSSEASESASATESSDSSESASATESSDSSESASATTTKSSEPSESESAEPTPSKDKKSSARDALSSKDGKPTPLAIFGIVAGVLAAVAAAFPVIAKTLNLNIKLPF